MGETQSHMLGAFLATAFAQAAEARASMPEEERKDFTLYVDEFQNFATNSFASVLSEARKYRLNLVLAHQFVAQIPEDLRYAVLGNVGTHIVFRVGADDAGILSKELGLANTTTLTDTSNYHAWIRTVRDGTPSSPTHLTTLEAKPTPGRLEAVRQITRKRHSRRRTDVEAEIEASFAQT